MFKVPNQYRVRRGDFASEDALGNAGIFVMPLEKDREGKPKPTGLHAQCMASDHSGWEHVSIVLSNISHSRKTYPVRRCPTWEEMCLIKEMFWDDPEDCVLQFHAPKSEYVSMRHCLHLWRPLDKSGKPKKISTPSPALVGFMPKPNPKPVT